MRAPSIEMISASLRNCSLGRGGGMPSPAAATEESEGEEVTVELNSEVALPYQWEQCLDIRTGEVYYINWEDGTRTTEDPRTTTTTYPSTYYSDEEDDTSDGDSSSVSSGGDGDNESSDTGFSSCISSSLSALSPEGEATSADTSGQILVAAGCKACFMYFMVPKRVEDCPKCGGVLFHLGRNDCF